MIITITAVMTIAAYKRKAAGDITTQELQHYETNVGGGGGIQHQEFISHLATFFFIPQRNIYLALLQGPTLPSQTQSHVLEVHEEQLMLNPRHKEHNREPQKCVTFPVT